MRKLITWNMMTLDGYFEGATKWDLHWHEYAWGEELHRFSLSQSSEIGVLLFGRVTYEGMAAYWTTASGESGDIAEFMNRVPKVVFSRSLTEATWNNTRLVSGDAADEVAALKQQDGGDLFVFGSAELSASLAARGLINEYRVGLNPLLLGRGNPLFKPAAAETRLNLLEATPLRCGVVILRYQPVAAANET